MAIRTCINNPDNHQRNLPFIISCVPGTIVAALCNPWSWRCSRFADKEREVLGSEEPKVLRLVHDGAGASLSPVWLQSCVICM